MSSQYTLSFAKARERPWLAMVGVLAVALSGCFGGGGTTPPEPPLEPEPEPAPAPEPEAFMGLFVSPLEVRYADTEVDTLENSRETALPALTSFVSVAYGESPGVSLPNDGDTYVESISENAMGGAWITFVINGETMSIDVDAYTAENGGEISTGDGAYYILSFPLTYERTPLQGQYSRNFCWD